MSEMLPADRPDLTPAAERMAQLVSEVSDGDLERPTPCRDPEGRVTTVGELLDHIGGLTIAFTAAAAKSSVGDGAGPPVPDASRLGDDWRTRIPADLAALAAAWRAPSAWEGETAAGGIDMPGAVAGVVALDELIVHGWDLARATSQPFECDAASVEACLDVVEQFSGPGSEEVRGTAFGPVVAVPADAPALDRLIGLTGRDPGWAPD